ncbi:MAG: hypothetical protein WA047_06155 [Phenylobacterium sp.]|uniref:hypothetical protein n=1 Tax=Phenylobacterium sp. TaxID=1871053 RepID=UPI003BB49462
MRKLLAAALLIAGPFLLAAPASAEPPFKYEYLPSEKCTLSKVEVQEPQLCLHLMQKFEADCAMVGGTKMTHGGKVACRTPRQATVKIPLTSTGPTFPGPAKTIKDKTLGDGSPGPYDAGSGAEAKTVGKDKIPKGCVLRPETCAGPK